MPASFSNLNANEARLDVTFPNGQTLFIRYRPANTTPREMHRIQSLRERPYEALTPAEARELSDATTKSLAASVIAWDLTDDDDKPVEPTMDGLADTPYIAQSALLELITNDMRLGKTSGSGPSPVSSTPS